MEQEFSFTTQVLDFFKLFYEVLIVLIRNLSNRISQETRKISINFHVAFFSCSWLFCSVANLMRSELNSLKWSRENVLWKDAEGLGFSSHHFGDATFFEITITTEYGNDKWATVLSYQTKNWLVLLKWQKKTASLSSPSYQNWPHHDNHFVATGP